MGNNQLHLNLERLSGFRFGTLQSWDYDLVLDGIILPQTDPVHNLGFLLDSQLLLEGQMAVGAKRAFIQLHIVHKL